MGRSAHSYWIIAVHSLFMVPAGIYSIVWTVQAIGSAL